MCQLTKEPTVVHYDQLLLTKFGKDLGFEFLLNLKVQTRM